MPQVPCHPCGGGASREADRLVLLNQFRGCRANVTLFPHETLFASLKRRVVTEGFIKQFLHQRGPAMCALHQPFAFQSSQVAANAWGRRAQRRNQFFYAHAAPLQQQFQDSLRPVFESFRHAIRRLYRITELSTDRLTPHFVRPIPWASVILSSACANYSPEMRPTCR